MKKELALQSAQDLTEPALWARSGDPGKGAWPRPSRYGDGSG